MKDGDGSINAKEVGTAMRSLGSCPGEQEVKELIRKTECPKTNVEKEISFDTLLEMMHVQMQNGCETRDNMATAFQVINHPFFPRIV